MAEPRFAPLVEAEFTMAQRAQAARIEKLTRPGTGTRGPFNIMLRSPGMAAGMIELFEYYRLASTLDPRLKELAILMVAREWTAQFEWFAHAPAAEKAGLAPATIEALRHGRRPPALRDDEAVIHDFVAAMLRDHEVGDATFAKARALLGEERLVDLVGLIGEYVKVSMILNLGRVAVPDGNAPPLLPRAKGEA